MLCLDFLWYLCLGRDHGPMDPNGWLNRPLPVARSASGTDEPSWMLLQKCVPKIHMWRQPISFIPVISLYKGSISMDFFGICSYESLHVMASNLKWLMGPESPLLLT